MEKIIAAIRTLNDNLKIVATRLEDIEKRVDTIEARIDGIGASLNDSIHKVAADTEARFAELTARVYALENATPTSPTIIGDALDDIVGAEEVAPTVVDDAETALDELLATVAAPTPAAPTPAAPTPAAPTPAAPTPAAPPKPTKTKAVVASAVRRRAFARQYMVENGAKVEDLRSPAKIEEVIKTEEFQKWVAAR